MSQPVKKKFVYSKTFQKIVNIHKIRKVHFKELFANNSNNSRINYLFTNKLYSQITKFEKITCLKIAKYLKNSFKLIFIINRDAI